MFNFIKKFILNLDFVKDEINKSILEDRKHRKVVDDKDKLIEDLSNENDVLKNKLVLVYNDNDKANVSLIDKIDIDSDGEYDIILENTQK